MKQVPLLDLISSIVDNRGKTCPTTEVGIPLIATNCIRNDALFPKYEKVRYVSQKTYETWFRGHPAPGDIIFVNKGTPGLVCMVPEPVDFCIAQDMVALRPDPSKVYPRYLFAALRSPQVQYSISSMHVGTLIPHFKKGDFDKLFIPLPDAETQKVIGDVYYNLSLKIELNRRMNQTLEAIARAIFKSWFVDFDPVIYNALAAGKPIPEKFAERAARRAQLAQGKSPLPENIRRLFPDEFQDSELGPIPKGWKTASFADTVEILSGGTPKTSVPEYWGGEIPWFSVTDVPQESDVFVIDTKKKVTEAGVEGSSTRILPKRTTIITARGTVGKVALAGVPMAINQSCYGLRGRHDKLGYFTYYCTSNLVSLLQQNVHGSVFDTITRRTFSDVIAVVPSKLVIAEFEAYVEPFLTYILSGLYRTEYLSALRDILLPKLLSGELEAQVSNKLVEGGRSET